MRHYPNIVSTRTYADRLETLANVREAGIRLSDAIEIVGLATAHRLQYIGPVEA